MSYIWYFNTSGRSAPSFRDCHRGPMTEIEARMALPFVTMASSEMLRVYLLESIVDTDLMAVRTRESILRVVNSLIGPAIPSVYATRDRIQTLICEKRRSTDIDSDIHANPVSYIQGARQLRNHKVVQPTIDILLGALESNSPITRVAGRCAVVVLCTLIEMDAQT